MTNTKQPKNIVICCDGTGNQYGEYNTNVVLTFESIIKSRSEQLVLYHPGVGTKSTTRWSFYFYRWLNKLLGLAFGFGLQINVEDAYSFLMRNYNQGDRVFLFGFSRGAHTVRRLAFMLDKCGLLLSGNKNLISYASEMYLGKDSVKDKDILEGFKTTFCQPCDIHFLGVWDTVSAVPRYRKNKLDGVLAPNTKYVYHAVSIDERRRKFPVYLFDENKVGSSQTVEQVWFAGFHSDVGGYFNERGVSNIALKWMLEKAQNCGLKVKSDIIDSLKLDPSDNIHESYAGFWRLVPFNIYYIILLLVLVPLGLCLGQYEMMITWPFIITSIAIFIGITYFNQKKREIPKGSNVHESVRRRKEISRDYRPRNLVDSNVNFVD